MRRLRQIVIVTEAAGQTLHASLAPGQRLVTREGALWRWDGFAAAGGSVTPAAQRLAERNRLTGLVAAEDKARSALAHLEAAEQHAIALASEAEAEVKQLRSTWRETQAALAQTREALNGLERRARETEAKLAASPRNGRRRKPTLPTPARSSTKPRTRSCGLKKMPPSRHFLLPRNQKQAHRRTALTLAANQISNHERDRSLRRARLDTIRAERERWTTRLTNAGRHISDLKDRIAKAASG